MDCILFTVVLTTDQRWENVQGRALGAMFEGQDYDEKHSPSRGTFTFGPISLGYHT